MKSLQQLLSGSSQALVLALAVIGCATAAVITGHITSTDYLGLVAGVGVVGGTVTTAHVVGTQVNNAATPPPPPVSSATGTAAPPAGGGGAPQP